MRKYVLCKYRKPWSILDRYGLFSFLSFPAFHYIVSICNSGEFVFSTWLLPLRLVSKTSSKASFYVYLCPSVSCSIFSLSFSPPLPSLSYLRLLVCANSFPSYLTVAWSARTPFQMLSSADNLPHPRCLAYIIETSRLNTATLHPPHCR